MPRTGSYPTLSLLTDSAANDSDKTVTVPASTQYRLQAISVTLVTTASVGNRQVDILITDAADATLIKYAAGAVQAASLTRNYFFAPGHTQDTGFTGTLMYRNLAANLIIPAGYKIRVYDSAAIAAAADDMTVNLWVEVLTE